jgi:hypothetical protein
MPEPLFHFLYILDEPYALVVIIQELVQCCIELLHDLCHSFQTLHPLITVILRAWAVILLLRVPTLRLRGSGRLRHHCIAMCSTKSCT